MQGQCKERHGVGGAEGGRRERPEQVATPRALQTDPRGNMGTEEVDQEHQEDVDL